MTAPRPDEQSSCNDAAGLVVTVAPLPDLATLADDWQALERRADPSFFLSWGWIDCWLRRLPVSIAPRLLRATIDGHPVALAIVVARTSWRKGVIRSRGLHLHETGDPDLDCLTIEHNGLLLDRQAGPQVEARCLDFLLSDPVADELHLSGVGMKRLAAVERLDRRCRVRDQKPIYTIDLADLRQRGTGLEAALSANSRHQLKRSRRWYETKGPVGIAAATTVEDALAILDELKELHQRQWRARGHPGAFASCFFEEFHRDLVRARFAAAEIQLLRITAGKSTVGCLYNFVHAGRVYYYQSGFTYPDRPAIKPGLICHALAAEWNIERGARTYDLLAGDSRFKRSIATDRSELLWLSVQKSRLRFRLEEGLRRVKASLSGCPFPLAIHRRASP